MGDSFPNHFTNEHEILFYEGISNQSYQSKNGKVKSPVMIKNQELLKENMSSPEFSLFHMASPDLERLIVGQTSASETATTNSRGTSTINTSDLNVLNLVSPDFEKIFSNFNDKGEELNKGRSVQKQHEVYTKTFVDALHKIQGEQQLGNKAHNIDGTRQRENRNYNFDTQKYQFVRRKERNEEQQFMSGQDRRVQNMNLSNYGNFELGSMEDKNRNKIGPIEQHSFRSKSGDIGGMTREDGNRNTIRSHYGNHSSIFDTYNTGSNTQVEVGNRHTGLGVQNIRTIPANQSNSSALTMGNGNPIQASYSDPGSSNRNQSNLNQSNPNINPGNRSNPSEINLESHPELFKLHAHIKLSENMRDHMEQIPSGHQDVHTTPQMFPLPPIDLQVQEIVKRERKKQKNRVAASKCRKKKLEREAQLEVKVQQLRERNVELTTIASALKNQLTDLKQHVMEHIACGCHVTAY